MVGLLFDDRISIRYDGLDADSHMIELAALSESLKGLTRVIAVTANFAATQKFSQHKDALSVRVYALPPEANCFELFTSIQWIEQSQLAVTVFGGLTVSLISYVFARAANQRAEMKQLSAALETAIKELGNKDQAVISRLLDTVDKMADALKPASKAAVQPISTTARTMTISRVKIDGSRGESVVIGAKERDAILSAAEAEFTDEKEFTLTIWEMNLDNDACRVSLANDEDTRIAAQIMDPTVVLPNNPYSLAFAARSEIIVRGKGMIVDGLLEKIYISHFLSQHENF